MIKRQDPNLQKYKMAMHFFIIPKHCFALLVEREVRNVCQPKEIKNKKSYVWCCKIKHGVFRLFCKHVIPFDACKHACKHTHTPMTHNTIQTHAIFFISPTKHKSCSHTHTHTHTSLLLLKTQLPKLTKQTPNKFFCIFIQY